MAAVRSRTKEKEKCTNGRARSGGRFEGKARIEADQSGKINFFFLGGGGKRVWYQ
jgi:hypothetical protein